MWNNNLRNLDPIQVCVVPSFRAFFGGHVKVNGGEGVSVGCWCESSFT